MVNMAVLCTRTSYSVGGGGELRSLFYLVGVAVVGSELQLGFPHRVLLRGKKRNQRCRGRRVGCASFLMQMVVVRVAMSSWEAL